MLCPPAANPPTGTLIPHALYAAAIFVGLKLPRAPPNDPGERVGLGVGRGAEELRGAGIVIPCLTKHPRWAVVRLAKRFPPRALSAAVVGFVIGLGTTTFAFTVGFAVAFALVFGFGVALVAAKDAGAALTSRTETARNSEE